MSYTYIEDLAALAPEVPEDSILSRTFHDGEGVRSILFGFAAGQELSEHTAARPAVLHFLKGEAHLTLGEDEMEASAGTWVHMPPNMPHSVNARTDVVMLLLLLEAGS